MFLSNNVEKLGRNIWSFNISRNSCVAYRTELCKVYCYGKRGRFLFKNSVKLADFNYECSKSRYFVEAMSMEISKLRVLRGLEYVRLHSIGDFYSQAYFNKWCNLADRFHKVIFLAYTRNYDIDFSSSPSNLKLYYSIDNSTEKFNKTIKKYAYAIRKEQSLDEIHGRLCSKKCSECKYCYNLNSGNVIFKIH